MPHFMLQEILKHSSQHVSEGHELPTDPVSIFHFNLLPGGICRNEELRNDLVNKRFSETVLESVKLLLAAPLNASTGEAQDGSAPSVSSEEKDRINRLMGAVASLMRSDDIIAGGLFPHLIAQKAL